MLAKEGSLKEELTQKQQQIAKSYDDVPYESHPFADSNPEHLASVAKLFGIESAPVETAKVLEIGCSMGGNLIPLAINYPKASFIGIDLAESQIKEAKQKSKALALSNIEFKAEDITKSLGKLGKFDYIICHGVYSWVPSDVQDAILELCNQHLNANGLAFISYNTYPGWKSKEIVRDAMLLRGNTQTDPLKRLAHAKGMVNFLQEMAPANSLLKTIITSEADVVRNAASHYLMHEYLEDYNQPCYFKDFIAKANKHDLAYLSEAEINTMFVSNFGAHIAQPLLAEANNDQVTLEQYMDFVRNRQFRQTILIKQAQKQNVHYKIRNEDLKLFEFAGRFNPQSTVEMDYVPVTFKDNAGRELSVSQPIEKATLLTINQHAPASINFRQILEGAQTLLGTKLPIHMDVISALIEQLVIQGFLRFTIYGKKPQLTIDDKPKLNKLASFDSTYQVNTGTASPWHESIRFNLIQSHLLPLLDGKHSKQDLAEHLVKLVKAKTITFNQNNIPVTDESLFETLAKEHVTSCLELTRQQGLLI